MFVSLSILVLVITAASAAPQATSTSSSTTPGPSSTIVTTTTTHVTTPTTTKANSLTYSATYTPGVNLPTKSEAGQTGTNSCGTTSSNSSMCQNLFVNSVTDFCLYGPPNGGTIGVTEQIEVAYCLNEGYGTRIFPEGTIIGAHFVETPDYVQVTGNGDFTKIGITAGDEGGELDPHGYNKLGNPIGGLVFGNSYGVMQQYHEWTNFMSDTQFCIRACNPAGPNPAGLCNHIYDVQGCLWNMPGNYDNGYFEDCLGDSALPMGVYGTSTFYQGEGATPPAHPAPSSSDCVRVASLTPGSVQPPSPTTSTVSVSTIFSVSSGTPSAITFVESIQTLAAKTTVSVAAATGTSGGSGGSGSSSKSGAMRMHAWTDQLCAFVALSLVTLLFSL